MHTPDLIHTSGLSIPQAPATRRPADSAAEAGIAHVLSTPKDTAPGVAPDLSWIAEEHRRLLEG